jgi:nucleoside-diphosphate-sugar epimerase
VTGADGFVGTGLLPRLRRDGHELRANQRRSGGLAVGPIADWSGLLEGIDVVIHLAARVHVTRDDSGDPLAAFRHVNVDGTARLAAQAEAAGVRRFMLLSSVKAATETSYGRKRVESDPDEPRTPYGISKREGELALAAEARRMDTVVLRPPLVYGPGVGANFRGLLRLIDSGLPLPLASVRNARSLIARDNLADAIAVAVSAPALAGRTFYVADGPSLSTPDLIRALAAALERPARLFRFPVGLLKVAAELAGRAEAAESLLGSLEIDDGAFRSVTGWTPPLDQHAGFRLVAQWWRGLRP